MSKKVITLSIVIGCFSCFSMFSQTVTIKAEKYKHVFEGVGTSIGLYAGHHWSMDSIGQDSAIRLINKDCNMVYLQDYAGSYPDEKPSYFDKRSDYFKDARAYRPDNKISIVVNNFPDNLMKEDILDVERDSIYYDVADWYFQVIKGFKERDIDVDILNLVNEPDYNKWQRYGYGNAKVGVGYLLKEAIPILRSMINDTSLNKIGIKMPLVMAPSTLGVNPCLNWVKYFKLEDPDAWEQIDIVATHQYNDGHKQYLFEEITDSIEGKPFFQSEMHTNRGDGLGDLPIENPHRGCLSFARVFSASVNGGLHAWFYFENNYPQEYHAGGLIRVAWNKKPKPYKHYYAFKQMTSTQPVNSHVLENDLEGFSDKKEVLSFRKQGEDTVYVNLSNFKAIRRQISIEVVDSINTYGIKSIKGWSTDEILNGKLILDESYSKSHDKFTFNMEPYSVNTFKIVIDTSGYDQEMISQTLTFNTIASKNINEKYFVLDGSLSSGQDVQYELISGSARISQDTLYLDGAGEVSIKAYHSGNDTLLASNIIEQTFCVNPSKPDIVVDGNMLTSSSSSGNQWILDGSTISGATGKTYSATKTGDYKVRVSIDGCSNTSDEVSVIYTGIDKEQINSLYIININYNELHILRKDNFNIRSVHLYNINGVKVIERNDIFSNRISIGLDNIANGIYMLKIVDDKGNYIVRKISKL